MSELAKWYAEQCNGDWEHTWGVRIVTTDNPGWLVEVDLHQTDADGLRTKGKVGTVEWETADGVLLGYCGPLKLDALLSKLASLLRSATPPNRVREV